MEELFPAAQGGEVGLDVGESNGGVRNKLVEVLHEHFLGQYRQTVEGTIGKPLVEAPVERRVGVSVLPQQSELSGLVRPQLTTRPPVPLAQPVA